MSANIESFDFEGNDAHEAGCAAGESIASAVMAAYGPTADDLADAFTLRLVGSNAFLAGVARELKLAAEAARAEGELGEEG